jgi:hypothetical protein
LQFVVKLKCEGFPPSRERRIVIFGALQYMTVTEL